MHDVFSCGSIGKRENPMIPAAGFCRAAPGQTAKRPRRRPSKEKSAAICIAARPFRLPNGLNSPVQQPVSYKHMTL
ncbi:hypothetical protein K7N18_27465, partial [Burkholderia arboris]|uniref:hypothetical protein n=1 Tax=Burkholderia arboris TaxID=488730 RepID=UPI001CA3FAA6